VPRSYAIGMKKDVGLDVHFPIVFLQNQLHRKVSSIFPVLESYVPKT
jgi:hypothetical protein